MLRLLEADFEKVKNFLHESPSFVYAVLEQIIPGFVYTDSSNKNTFLIGTNSGIFYIIGDESNSYFNNALLELYRNRTNNKARFTLFSSSENWDNVINDLFKNEVSKLRRYNFTFNRQSYSNNKMQLPKEYALKKADEEMKYC